jgi:hypothetical protein
MTKEEEALLTALRNVKRLLTSIDDAKSGRIDRALAIVNAALKDAPPHPGYCLSCKSAGCGTWTQCDKPRYAAGHPLAGIGEGRWIKEGEEGT